MQYHVVATDAEQYVTDWVVSDDLDEATDAWNEFACDGDSTIYDEHDGSLDLLNYNDPTTYDA